MKSNLACATLKRQERHIKTLSRIALCVLMALNAALPGHASGPAPRITTHSKTKNLCQPQIVNVDLQDHKLEVRAISGAILFTSGMRIDADGAPNAYGPHNWGLDYTANAKNGSLWSGVATDSSGNPVVQRSGRYKGLYVSQTTLRKNGASATSPQTYVNASRIPFIALPADFTQQFGVNLGDLAVVVNTANGKRAYAIYADVGPNGKIGEGSIALAKALGIDAKPRSGGATRGIVYLIFPKSGLGQGKLRTLSEINASGSRLFKRWGAEKQLRACGNNSR
jgi:hypothetical protein